ncbi:Helicase C-terminal [Penicillium malachiteum]|uniref:Helicase C-terminal n=1 Tax=Penicillium malachiteum TaxID=1324776 RepID=UPI0025485CB0|nr:Helicase C-terminal [Penicillium malachiteum]KAJ5726281.1 Helicase C-terminal [Penicillium malachiteum]
MFRLTSLTPKTILPRTPLKILRTLSLKPPRAKGWTDPTPYNYAEYANQNTDDWAGAATRYEWQAEWNDEYGDIGPRNEELEKQLFEGELITRAGSRLQELNNPLLVTCESETDISAIGEWDDAGLHPIMRENVRLCLYDKPTTVQSFVLPAVMQGKDVIGIAQTGSGKTGAFLIPILSKLMGKAKKLAAARPDVTKEYNPAEDGVRAEPLVLVVCPTRELATQIFDEARRLCYRSMLRPCVAYGGAPARFQRDELRKGCDILIGTPGRILDFMGQPHVLSLRRVRFTVIDEADELLQIDWEDDFKKIMSGGDMNEDDDHRYMMFSATFDKECRKLARTYLGASHIRVRVGRPGSSHLNVTQTLNKVLYVDDNKKKQALYDLLLSMVPIRTLVFVNNKEQVDYVDDFLFHKGLPSTSIHGGRTQREREDAIRSFRSARCPIMVATGLSARGLDIVNVMHVINFDLPKVQHGGTTEYIHRIGRTARIGNEGVATSFYNENDQDIATDLVKILIECNQTIPDFLEEFRPDENDITFDDDTDKDEPNSDSESDDAEKDHEEDSAQQQSPGGTADSLWASNEPQESGQAW